MEEFKPTLCVICHEVKSYENCIIIDETVQSVLDTVLFKRLVEVNVSAICNPCYTKAFEVYQFKEVYTDTEDCIFPDINPTNGTPVDLKEIYLKDRDEEQSKSVSEDERICRLCMQSVTSGYTCVRDLEVDLICKYIPEVNFNSTEEPVICRGCVDSVKTHGGFLSEHFGVHKFENVCKEETMDGQFDIKMEEIEIKSEEDNQDTGTLPSTNKLPVCNTNIEDGLKTQQLETATYKCNICAYRSPIKHNLISHQLKHRELSEVPTYKCDMCHYITKRKRNLVTHGLIHKDVSEIQMYKCDTCSYETKRKGALAKHVLIHKDASRAQMYHCDICTYETKHRQNLVDHKIRHKDISEVHTYKCDICTYESKHRKSLINHKLSHKDSSEVQMYKCDICNLETKYKGNLVKHQQMHKLIFSMQIYRCDICNFETKYKRNIINHRQMHEYISQVQMYKCNSCNFETKYKRNLIRHQQIHKYISNTKMSMDMFPIAS